MANVFVAVLAEACANGANAVCSPALWGAARADARRVDGQWFGFSGFRPLAGPKVIGR